MVGFSVGCKVGVLNDTISGTIIRINLKKCVIEDEYGFERIYKMSELVLSKTNSDYNLSDSKTNSHIQNKLNADKPKRKAKVKSSDKNNNVHSNSLVIDLHIEELVDNHSYMTNFEIVQRQMQSCRMTIEKALQLRVKKVILIHGKGEGVLRNEIHTYLERLENTKHIKLEIIDASYTQFGVGGATEVNIL